ncbi:MAG: Fe-S protein assembly co-chaperone HscB [Pseudomonadota bacterium]|jgi:molecular chaperone HscB
MDAFDVLGLAPTFDLDSKVLEQRYRDLQRALHPDKFAQASASERRASLSRAVSVNEAYRALRDQLKRAEVLFVRLGGELAEGAGQPADPALLMEVMELREQLSDTKQSGDVAARERLTSEVRDLNHQSLDALRSALGALQGGDDQARQVAARALSRLRYYRRFLDEVAVLEDAHDSLD